MDIKDKNNNQLFKLYTLAELAYKKHFSTSMENQEYLFPEGWYENNNYKEKIEIITEALKENTLIINTKRYNESLEGIKNLSKQNDKY